MMRSVGQRGHYYVIELSTRFDCCMELQQLFSTLFSVN